MNINDLRTLGACPAAIRWAEHYATLEVAWQVCSRADWMLWLAAKYIGKRGSAGHRKLVLATCACARTALHHVNEGEERPRIAIETTEAWARGDATIEDVRAAAAAAYAAYGDAYGYAAAAAYAAYAAYANAAAAAYAAYAAYATVRADIVRTFYPHLSDVQGASQ